MTFHLSQVWNIFPDVLIYIKAVIIFPYFVDEKINAQKRNWSLLKFTQLNYNDYMDLKTRMWLQTKCPHYTSRNILEGSSGYYPVE